jgi:hypothetical protein
MISMTRIKTTKQANTMAMMPEISRVMLDSKTISEVEPSRSEHAVKEFRPTSAFTDTDTALLSEDANHAFCSPKFRQ